MSRTVVIVDDHERFRRSARTLLELEGYSVVGEAADGAEAVEAVERLRPELVLLDIGLPDANGFDVADRLAGRTQIVLISSREPIDLGRRLDRTDALGFISKEELSAATLAELVDVAE